MEEVKRRQKPDWLKIKVPIGKQYVEVRDVIEGNKLHTICTSGQCPNKEDCWGRGTATFMILGNICTRSCKFCAVATGRPLPADLGRTGQDRRIGPAHETASLRHHFRRPRRPGRRRCRYLGSNDQGCKRNEPKSNYRNAGA